MVNTTLDNRPTDPVESWIDHPNNKDSLDSKGVGKRLNFAQARKGKMFFSFGSNSNLVTQDTIQDKK